jgi:hypothetical protein
MDISIILGLIVAVIGLIGLIYVFIVYFKLKGSLKKAYSLIAFGLFFGYLAILSLVLRDFAILSDANECILIKILLGITSILIGIGCMKFSKLVDYIPDNLLKSINKYRH